MAKDSSKLAEGYEKLYSEVSEKITGGKQDTLTSLNKDNSEQLKDFFKERIPFSDQKEIEQEFKKTFPLYKQSGKGKKIKKPQPTRRPGKKYLSSKERRDLCMNKLPKKGLKFKDFHSLHRLWTGYMKDLLDFDKYRPGDEQFQMRLCRADYHGALIKVTRSKNPSSVGIEGYIIMETRNMFKILARDNILKTVPKSITSFSFVLEGCLITLGGSNMCLKPSERAVKKWKNKGPYDL